MSCEYAHLDGSYVLGSLSSSERLEYERHLAGCRSCSAAVQELAGLPGLLAKVPPEVWESGPVDEPMPEGLLDGVVTRARRSRRRRTSVVAALSVAAAAVVATGSFALVDGVAHRGADNPPSSTTQTPVGRAMVAVAPTSMSAKLLVTEVAWGTRLDLTCSYPAGDQYWDGSESVYTLVVRTRDGRQQRVATWHPLLGTMELSAATAARVQDIVSVEIRDAGGAPLLRLTT